MDSTDRAGVASSHLPHLPPERYDPAGKPGRVQSVYWDAGGAAGVARHSAEIRAALASGRAERFIRGRAYARMIEAEPERRRARHRDRHQASGVMEQSPTCAVSCCCGSIAAGSRSRVFPSVLDRLVAALMRCALMLPSRTSASRAWLDGRVISLGAVEGSSAWRCRSRPAHSESTKLLVRGVWRLVAICHDRCVDPWDRESSIPGATG